MNKSEVREVATLAKYHAIGLSDCVARGLSSLIRAARTTRSRAALMEYADIFNVRSHPEFIV